jgi:hypothetical protein
MFKDKITQKLKRKACVEKDKQPRKGNERFDFILGEGLIYHKMDPLTKDKTLMDLFNFDITSMQLFSENIDI